MGKVIKRDSDEIGRRNFLKKAGAVAALAIVGGFGFLLGRSQDVKAIPPATQSWNIESNMETFGFLVWTDANATDVLARNGKTGTNTYSTNATNGNEATVASLIQDVFQNAV